MVSIQRRSKAVEVEARCCLGPGRYTCEWSGLVLGTAKKHSRLTTFKQCCSQTTFLVDKCALLMNYRNVLRDFSAPVCWKLFDQGWAVQHISNKYISCPRGRCSLNFWGPQRALSTPSPARSVKQGCSPGQTDQRQHSWPLSLGFTPLLLFSVLVL